MIRGEVSRDFDEKNQNIFIYYREIALYNNSWVTEAMLVYFQDSKVMHESTLVFSSLFD